jgi:20S proteasome alpha/beta subunit
LASNSYSTNFPVAQNPISEGGQFVTSTSPGVNWSGLETGGGGNLPVAPVDIAASGEAESVDYANPNYGDALAVLTGNWGANQSASITVGDIPATSAGYEEFEIHLRTDPTTGTGYEITWAYNHDYILITTWNGGGVVGTGAYTILYQASGPQYAIAPGDTLTASIQGNVITMYTDGVQVAQITDSKFSSGNPGFGFNGGWQTGEYGISSFSASSSDAQAVIESLGVTSLVQVGSNYFMNPVAGGTGPELKYQGSPVVAQAGAWSPIGVEQTSTGYEVAWKNVSTGQYTVWNTDSNGNYVSDTIGAVSGTSTALESLEPSFHQDLNGDGVIGVPPSATTSSIETFGSTALVQVGSNYFMNPVAGGTGPELKYQGSPVVAQAGAWSPIGVEQTSTGYEVAWKNVSTGQYTVWNTDSNGNYVSDTIGAVSGTSTALESLEPSFHQDLNGDGVIGVPPSATASSIESFGSTAVVQVGSNYFMNPVAGGTGPELKYQGSPVVAQAGAWSPIGVEQTATGYEVAWKNVSTGQYTVWNTDSNGNYVSDTIGAVSGTSTALESLEPSFHQDLNGDGVIGVPPSATASSIQSFGSTALVQVGSNYFMNPVAGGTGPELKYQGSPVVAQAGAWSPIGVEQTSTGYEVAWKNVSTGQYTVWNTDSNGNYVSDTIGAVSGTSTALESLEPSFQQDLNGDGVIGVPPSATTSSIVASPATVSASQDLTGSSGRDTFVFSQPIGSDVVHSFDVSSDTIDLIGYSLQSFGDVQAHTADDANGNAVITLADGQTITLDGVHRADLTAANFEFDVTPTTENPGTMSIGDGAIQPLSGIIDNTGTIALNSAGTETDLELIEHGITLQGGGQFVLSDNAQNVVFGTAADVTLTNVDNTISGAGQLGQGQLDLVNEATINASGTNALVVDTGSNVIINSGTLEATGSGGLVIDSAVQNSGKIWADGGNVTVSAAVTGNGTATISGSTMLEFAAASDANTSFAAGATGTLKLDQAENFTGTISGFGAGDALDLTDIASGANLTVGYTANADGSGGTLSVSDGMHTASIALLGQFAASGFQVGSDAGSGTMVTYTPPDQGSGSLITPPKS